MHVLIVGFGATGQILATNLVAQGHQVTGMRRQPVPQSTVTGITMLAQSVHTSHLNQLAPIDWVYVLLTPDERTEAAYQRIFIDSLAPLYQALKQHPVQKVVFVSSTSVYGKGQGEHLDESSPIQPDTPTAKVLAQAEQAWRDYWQEKLVIVRPSGIYANNRLRLVHWVQQQKPVLANQWTNRIHIHDLAGFLAYLTHLVAIAPLYVVSDRQPAYQHEVLQFIASQLACDMPPVVPAGISGKRLSSALMQNSGYLLAYPDYYTGYRAVLSTILR